MDYAKQLLQDIDALDGERWFPKESEFEDDLPLGRMGSIFGMS